VAFPLLIIPLAIYNMFVFLTPPDDGWAAKVTTVRLPSGVDWTITFGDVLIAGSLLLLMIELIKPARPGTKTFIDHFLSLIVLGAAGAEFALLKQASTPTFAMLCVMCLVEFIGGIFISARSSRVPREVAAVAAVAPARAADEAPARAAEPPARAAEPAHFLPNVSPLRDSYTSYPTDRSHQ
jgi:hypothetical protein